MDLLAILRRSGGIDALARQIGMPPTTVSAAVETLLPGLLRGLSDYAQRLGGRETGVAALLAMIDGLSEGNLAAEVMGPGPLNGESGERIVAQFLGSPDAKLRLVGEAAAAGGHEAALLERIVPLLAMLVCGYIAARAKADDAQGEGLDWLRELLMLQDPDEPRANSGSAA